MPETVDLKLSPRHLPAPEIPPPEADRGTSLWKDAWHRLRKNRFALYSLVVFALTTLVCFLAPLVYPHSPRDQSLSLGASRPLAPLMQVEELGSQREPRLLTIERFRESTTERVRENRRPRALTAAEQEAILAAVTAGKEHRIAETIYRAVRQRHLLGTDQLGRDLFARIMDGGQVSLGIGFLATFVSVVIGVLYGSIAAYVGGKTDAVMMRLVDILYALPFTIFVILLMVIFGRSIILLFIAIGAVEWLTMARIVRGQVLSLKKMEFIEAAHALGLSNRRIVLRHIIPNVMGPVIVFSTLTVPAVMLLEAALSFLGLGVQPPHASWGVLIKEGSDAMQMFPWLLLFPAVIFSLTLFCLNFLGDGLRDALDVKASKD